MKLLKKVIQKFLVLAFWIGIWKLLSLYVNKELLLPSPENVILRLFELMKHSNFYIVFLHSILRVLFGTAVAIVLGTLFGVITSFVPVLHKLFAPIMQIIKSTPVASFIVLLLLWVGRDIMPSIISILILMPVVWTNIETGIKQTDKKLLDMAFAYKMNKCKLAKYIYLPSVMPYFVSALKSSIGMSWKAGIAAEVLALPIFAVGTQIFNSKLYLETTDLFAWTLSVVIVSLIIEKAVILPTRIYTRIRSGGGEKFDGI